MIPGIACILGPHKRMTVIPSRTGRGVELGTPKYRESWKHRNSAFRRYLRLPLSSLRLASGSPNCPTDPPLKTAKPPWRQLGHTVLVIKAGSHFWSSPGRSHKSSCAQVLRRDSNPANSHILFLLFTLTST